MKKQYIFIIMIIVILYLFYLIISFTYKEYKITENIDYITLLNKELRENINKADSIINYKKSKAYINKALKEQQSLKNKGEVVVYLTTEKNYNKYTSEIIEEKITPSNALQNDNITSSMNIHQKWIYLIFGKDLR